MKNNGHHYTLDLNRLEVKMVKCNRCGRVISTDNSYQHFGETLCEDCYIDIKYPVKACDPWAVYAATRSRGNTGAEGSNGLSETQKRIYEFVKTKEKVTRAEILANLKINETELQTNLAVLRHCELVKGHKEGKDIYLVTFDFNKDNYAEE